MRMSFDTFFISGVSSPRDVNRRTTGDTPFASIRPMGLHSGVRTAAVLPTTAQLSPHAIVHHQTPHTTGIAYIFFFMA